MPHTLRTARLLLRAPSPRDVAPAHRAFNEFDIVRMTSRWPWPLTEQYVRSRLVGRIGPFDALTFSIIAGERLIGTIGGGLRGDEGAFDIGYMLARSAWGRGFATEALTAYCRFVFAVVRPRIIYAEHWADNPASGRVLMKTGFSRLGSIAPKWCEARSAMTAGVAYARATP